MLWNHPEASCTHYFFWGGGGGGAYVLLIFPFLLEIFPNALSISQNISILTFIDDVSCSMVGDGQSNLIMQSINYA